jgi:hypothetical protein
MHFKQDKRVINARGLEMPQKAFYSLNCQIYCLKPQTFRGKNAVTTSKAMQ